MEPDPVIGSSSGTPRESTDGLGLRNASTSRSLPFQPALTRSNSRVSIDSFRPSFDGQSVPGTPNLGRKGTKDASNEKRGQDKNNERTWLHRIAIRFDDFLDSKLGTKAVGLSLAGLFDELAWSDVVSLISAWKVQIGLAVFAVAISPSLFLFVFAVVIGVFLGLYLSPLARHGGSSSRGTGELKVIWKDDGRKATIPRRKRDQIALPDVVSSALLGQLDTLISYFLRDFIRAWWNPMGNMAKPPDFVDSLRRTLESAAATGISQAKTTVPASLMIPLVHAITQHLRLYRTFESSGLPFSAYIAKNPSSPLSRFSSDALIESHLHTLSQLILSRTVPDDESGPTGIALARSSLSLFILLQTLLALSDPDFWNQRIVEALGGVPYGMAGVEVVSKPDVKARKIPPLATVWVRLIEAGRLSIPGAVGTVYATVRVGVDELRTGRVPGESNPVFDWEGWFEFEAGGGEGNIDGIIVDVWGRGGLQDTLLGSLFISFVSHDPNTLHKRHHPLSISHITSTPASISSSELYLEFIRADPDAPLQGHEGHLGRGKTPVEIIEFVRRGGREEAETVKAPKPAFTGSAPKPTEPADATPTITLSAILLSPDLLPPLLGHIEKEHPGLLPLIQFLLDLDAFSLLASSSETPRATLLADGQRLLAGHFGPGSRMLGLVESGVLDRIKAGLDAGEPEVWDEARRWAIEVLEHSCLTRCGISGLRYVKETVKRGGSLEGRRSEGGVGRRGEEVIAEDLAGVIARAGVGSGKAVRRSKGKTVGARTVDPRKTPVVDRMGVEDARKRVRLLTGHIAGLQEAMIKLARTDPKSAQIAQLRVTRSSMEADLMAAQKIVEEDEKRFAPSNVLFGAGVRVRDMDERKPGETEDNTAFGKSARTLTRLKEAFVAAGSVVATGSTSKAAARAILYAVEVDSHGTGQRHGWVVLRSWADFQILHAKLSDQHAKVAKIAFPQRQRLTVETDSEARSRIANELERFLGMLLLDSKLCESVILQIFLQPDLLNFDEALANDGSELEHPFALVVDAFKTVGSGMTEAVSLVGTGMNEAVSAVSALGSGAVSMMGSGVGVVGSGMVGAVKGPVNLAGSLLKGISSATSSALSPQQQQLEDFRKSRKQGTFSSALMGTFGGFAGASTSTDMGFGKPFSNLAGDAPIRTPTSVTAGQARMYEQALGPPSAASTPPTRSAEYPRSSGSIGDVPPEDIYNVDPDLSLELAFTLLEEVFDVAAVRQTSLNIIKSVLRQTHRDTIRMAASRLIYGVAHDDAIAGHLQGLVGRFWPDGIWHLHNPNFEQPAIRTPEQKEATKLQAKRLLMQDSDPFGIMLTLDRLVGRYARVMGFIRLFNCIQSDDGMLTKSLLCTVFEVVAKVLLVGVEEVREEPTVVERPDKAYGGGTKAKAV